MRGLFEAAPAPLRAGWAPRAAELAPAALAAPRAGDVLMVKGSNGSAMAPIVAALRAQYPASGSGA
jgi:UDP-N-acetylmuramoyl-tripeptide--D-alanyl-D-alanine ligase